MPKKFNSQGGALPILMLVAAVGIVAFVLISNTFSFRVNLFSSIFPKPLSFAADLGPGILFIDSNNQLITQTSSPNIRVVLFSPYPPAASPSPSPTATASATPIPAIASVILAEDSNFTQNTKTYSPIPMSPMVVNYTLSGTGTKTVFAKFIAVNNQAQVFQSTITYLQPTSTPVASIAPSGNAHSFGLWTPSKWDTCTKEEHDSYFAIGPDGKKYPTWHPPVHIRANGSTCTFGHEHGRNPQGSAMLSFIKQLYGGVLIGYANEQLDVYNMAKGITNGMRHEDHVGHKVEWENNLQLNGCTNSEGACTGDRTKLNAYCDFFIKAHQGTHSKDAFTNNLHELGYFVSCRDSGNTGVGTFKLGVYKMVAFGTPGEIGEACNKDKTYSTGQAAPANSPTGSGIRFIPTKFCADTYFLVPDGEFTDTGLGLYEDWVSANYLVKASNPDNPLVYFDPHFAVFLPSRYFDPTKPDNLARSIDLCYTKDANGERAHNGECDNATNYGQIQGITYDDPRSPFNGLHREFYFNQTWISNSSSTTTWYTDPYGGKAATSPFPGSIKQYIPQINNYNNVILQSQALGKDRNYGGNGVHAPN